MKLCIHCKNRLSNPQVRICPKDECPYVAYVDKNIHSEDVPHIYLPKTPIKRALPA